MELRRILAENAAYRNVKALGRNATRRDRQVVIERPLADFQLARERSLGHRWPSSFQSRLDWVCGGDPAVLHCASLPSGPSRSVYSLFTMGSVAMLTPRNHRIHHACADKNAQVCYFGPGRRVMHPTPAPFQQLLRKRLSRRGELARLAEASGVRATVIARWKAGRTRPSTRNLWLLAPALGESYETLMRMCGYLPDLPELADGRHTRDERLDRVIRRWPALAEPVKDWL